VPIRSQSRVSPKAAIRSYGRTASRAAQAGGVLRAFREDQGRSQEELATAAGLHRTYVSMVERGERNPTLLSLDRVLGALGVSWTEFGECLDRSARGRSSK
jgi:transcriptional regulator with XRE-family HTH domain